MIVEIPSGLSSLIGAQGRVNQRHERLLVVLTYAVGFHVESKSPTEKTNVIAFDLIETLLKAPSYFPAAPLQYHRRGPEQGGRGPPPQPAPHGREAMARRHEGVNEAELPGRPRNRKVASMSASFGNSLADCS